VNFEWDDDKNRKNIRKHGLSFDKAYEVFRTSLPSEPDLREHYGEESDCCGYFYAPRRGYSSNHFLAEGIET